MSRADNLRAMREAQYTSPQGDRKLSNVPKHKSVTEIVTENQESLSQQVINVTPINVTPINVTPINVTPGTAPKARRGRPKKATALTAAQKQAAYRERKRGYS